MGRWGKREHILAAPWNYGLVTYATLQYNGQEKHGLPNVDKVKAGDQGFV